MFDRSERTLAPMVGLVLLATVAACGDAASTATDSTSGPSPQVTTSTAAGSSDAEALAASLEEAWTSGDGEALAELVPASAAELIGWGVPETFALVPDSCSAGEAGSARCELLVGIDGIGLLFAMSFSEGPGGDPQIDAVMFAGDAG